MQRRGQKKAEGLGGGGEEDWQRGPSLGERAAAWTQAGGLGWKPRQTFAEGFYRGVLPALFRTVGVVDAGVGPKKGSGWSPGTPGSLLHLQTLAAGLAAGHCWGFLEPGEQ